jgi:caffeoyl-CoA O-methyltransferase
MAASLEGSFVHDAVARYAAEHTVGPDELQQRLIAETAERTGGRAQMQISPQQGALMSMIVSLMSAEQAIEIGTFTGYSALAIARALPPDGHLLCCDVSEEWTSIGRRYWAEAGVADRIELRIGPALDTLRTLPEREQYDLAFVDADKTGYLAYVEELVPRIRRGGLIMVDNTLWSGEVVNADTTDETTVALRAFNDAVAADARLACVLLPIADGLTLLRKR